jgi:hypothetical protein
MSPVVSVWWSVCKQVSTVDMKNFKRKLNDIKGVEADKKLAQS